MVSSTSALSTSEQRFSAVVAILYRNIVLLVNGIIFAVVALLIMYGDTQEGVFLGLITIINIAIGCGQEINSWLALEKLQLLATPKVIRVNADGTESTILTEEIKKGDKIRLITGDQVPCDGKLISSHGFEVNEALITGESTSFLRKPSDAIFAGGILTSGSGIFEVEKIFAESRIALMTKNIKKYSLILSPIQYSINTVIKYVSYVLTLIIIFVATRGYIIHQSTVSIIQNIGALTSELLPQGLVVIATLLFTYGAIHLYRKNVLLQEVNATEKFGRIRNLCMDKTGTLTDTNLVVEYMHAAPHVDEKNAINLIASYIQNTSDASQTVEAVKVSLAAQHVEKYPCTVIDDLTFSSTRQFGAVHTKDTQGEHVILVGAPDFFLPYITDAESKAWVEKYIKTDAVIGKRLLCFVTTNVSAIPQNIAGQALSVVALYGMNSPLREGVVDAVTFFQDRGVRIRIISGDNAQTVQAVARSAGVKNCEALITGAEMETWTEADFLKKSSQYTVFGRIKPEQKEKIIEALRHDGFTAMIGDGANDALAIKKADLGIAMFAGAQATRQVASVVLVKNSFSDLPHGAKQADSVIQNIEICAVDQQRASRKNNS